MYSETAGPSAQADPSAQAESLAQLESLARMEPSEPEWEPIILRTYSKLGNKEINSLKIL